MAAAFSIRPLLASDLPECVSLWRSSEGVGLRPEESLEFFERFLERNPGLSHCAESCGGGGGILGCVLAGHDGKRGHLYHLAVRSQWRRQGVAKALCEKSLETLAKEGVSRSAISVFASNEAGLEFWLSCGWTLRDDLKSLTILRPS